MLAEIMEKAIEKRFKDGTPVLGFGEKGVPLKLRDVTHQVLRAWIDGDNIMGEIRLIGDPGSNPDRVKIEAMDIIFCSSVGYGCTRDEDGTPVVEDDYALVTFNIRDGGEPGG
jgi:hypothetical protein